VGCSSALRSSVLLGASVPLVVIARVAGRGTRIPEGGLFFVDLSNPNEAKKAAQAVADAERLLAKAKGALET
jgi:hypothetical protein